MDLNTEDGKIVKITYIQEYDQKRNLVPRWEISEKAGENLLQISLKNHIPHIHACGGNGKCSTCRVLILKGEENLSEPSSEEKKLSIQKGLRKKIRLACQTQVLGDIEIKRLVRDEIDADIVLTNRLTGREVSLAILYLRIHDFLKFSEKHIAYEVFQILNRFYKIIGDMILQHNGYMDKLTGEEVIAFFGFNDKDTIKKCNDAYLAAVEIIKNLEKFNKFIKENYNEEFKIGISLHFGTAMVGDLGHPEKMQISAIGDVLYVASRIEKINQVTKTVLLASEDFIKVQQNEALIHQKFKTTMKGQKGISYVYELFTNKKSYPSLRSLIKSEMTKILSPVILRLVFHDVMSGGSISSSFRDEDRLEFELRKPENSNLEEGVKFIKKIKELIQEEPYSYRDILYLAGAVAVEITGGPFINVVVPSFQDKTFFEVGIPDREETFESYFKKFSQLGFSKKDIVAIMGAHTLGKADHQPFTEDLFEFSNSYYKRLINDHQNANLHPLLKTDWQLLEDEECPKYVQIYAMDQTVFFEDFKNAYQKLISFAY